MTETRMKPVSWHERPRMNRLASILYPELADDQAKREMAFYSKQERKLSPMQAKMEGYKDQAKREKPRWVSNRWWDEN